MHPTPTCGCRQPLRTARDSRTRARERIPPEGLPPWTEDKIKLFPITWMSTVTCAHHFQVHPCVAQELLVDSLLEGASRARALYPDGTQHIMGLKEVHGLFYKMKRPAIAPSALSWCTRATGRKRTSSCFIIVACCILSPAHTS